MQGDSAAWTGHYLAAMAFKYNVTQDTATLGKIAGTLDAFDLLTNCSSKPGFLVRIAAKSDIKPFQAYYNGSNHEFQCAPPQQDYTWCALSRTCCCVPPNLKSLPPAPPVVLLVLCQAWLTVARHVHRDGVRADSNVAVRQLLHHPYHAVPCLRTRVCVLDACVEWSCARHVDDAPTRARVSNLTQRVIDLLVKDDWWILSPEKVRRGGVAHSD